MPSRPPSHSAPRPGDDVSTRAGLRTVAEALLAEATGAVRVVRLCLHCGSDGHGQPRLIGSPLAASISFARGLVAVAWGAGRVGIDIEHASSSGRRQGGPDDLAAWTRLEALAKAAGTGVRSWPDLTLPDLPTRSLELPTGYVGTVAGGAGVRLAGPAATSP